jgi:hypothetical protein
MPNQEVIRAVDRLIELAGHTTIVRHDPGEIQLKVKPRGILLALNLNLANLADLRLSIRGILGGEADLSAKSLIIRYDEKILPKELWELLVRGKSSPKLQRAVRDLLLSRLSRDDLATIQEVSERV